ncbi:MAG: hypothetical protein U0360_07415 [Dehalococcoidia bacterium]
MLLFAAMLAFVGLEAGEGASCAGVGGGRCDVTVAVLNARGQVVGTVLVDLEVHPAVSVIASTPASGTVVLDWFANGDCTGAPVAVSAAFAVVNGGVDASSFRQTPRKAGDYAFRARYSGDAQHAASSDCRSVAASRALPRVLASTLTASVAGGAAVTIDRPFEVNLGLALSADAPVGDATVTYTFDNSVLEPLRCPSGARLASHRAGPREAAWSAAHLPSDSRRSRGSGNSACARFVPPRPRAPRAR